MRGFSENAAHPRPSQQGYDAQQGYGGQQAHVGLPQVVWTLGGLRGVQGFSLFATDPADLWICGAVAAV